VLRRCVWSRNIKNGCSIYIYDISRLRVKRNQNGHFLDYRHSQVRYITGISCFRNFVPVELFHLAYPNIVSTITECVTRRLVCVGGKEEQDKISVGCLLHHSQQPRRNFEVSATTLYHRYIQLLGSFRKIAKSDYCLRLVSPSVLPRGKTRLPLDVFSWSLIFEFCSKICRDNSSFIKIW
jgi:hypothetical protein